MVTVQVPVSSISMILDTSLHCELMMLLSLRILAADFSGHLLVLKKQFGGAEEHSLLLQSKPIFTFVSLKSDTRNCYSNQGITQLFNFLCGMLNHIC